jgi:hypothetical protein
LWLITKCGSVQRWSLLKAASLLAAVLGPVVCLVCLLTFSSIRHLVTLIPNTGNFVTDSSDGYYYANSVVLNADAALVLNMTFFLFYNMFSGFSGLFLGATVTLTCCFQQWSLKVDVCCRIRVVFRVLCFIVCPVVQVMICMHPLILWCQDTGGGVQLLWDFIYTWSLPVFFGVVVDQVVLSSAFESLSRSQKMLENSMPKKLEQVILSVKCFRGILNYVEALTIYCICSLVGLQVGFVTLMWYLFEDIIAINSNYILPDSGSFVRATMLSTFVVCCVASQICFRVLLCPQAATTISENLHSSSRYDALREKKEQRSLCVESSENRKSAGGPPQTGNRRSLYSAVSAALSHSTVASPLVAGRQRASSSASLSASVLNGSSGPTTPAACVEGTTTGSAAGSVDGDDIFQSFVQIGDNGNIYYREFSTDYTYCFFCEKLRDSLKEWILETTEALYPEAFGWKVPYRRLSLCVGCIMVSLLLQEQLSDVDNFSAKTKIQSYLADIGGVSLQWPADGTIFDDAFIAFNDADRKQVHCLMAAVSLFWLSLLCDVLSSCIFPANLANLEMLVAGGSTGFTILRHKSIMLFFSRMCALFGGLLVFGMIVVSLVLQY